MPSEQAQPRQVSAGGSGSKAKEGRQLAVTAPADAVAATEEEEAPPPVPPAPAPSPPPPLTGFVARKTTLWPLVVYCSFVFFYVVLGGGEGSFVLESESEKSRWKVGGFFLLPFFFRPSFSPSLLFFSNKRLTNRLDPGHVHPLCDVRDAHDVAVDVPADLF